MPIALERRRAARILPAVRALALAVPLLVASCGGNAPGTILSVPNRVAVADLNGDGLNDIVVVSAQIDQTGLTQNNPGLLAVILQNASTKGSFAASLHYSTDGSPSGLAVGDLTNSGSQDIVVGDFSAGMVSVLMHDPNNKGQFLAAVNYPAGGSPNDVVIADMNGDGKPDLVIADGGSTGHVIVLPQDPANPGHFLAPILSAPLPNRAIRVAVGHITSNTAYDVIVTSFDTSGNGGTVSMFSPDPANPGGFLPRVDLAVPGTATSPGEPAGIVIADLNGDGLLDIAIAGEGPASDTTGTTGAMVLLQDPANPGQFLTPVTYYTETGSLSIAVADMNLDGHLDLVLVSQYPTGSGEISILLQDPNNAGTFQAATSIGGFGRPVSVALADMNGDGYPDIVTADGTGAIVYFQSSTTPGTYAAGTQVGG